MIQAFIAELDRGISHPRLARYRPRDGSDLDMAVTYFWNIALCEALYPTLDALEITLRNGVHRAAERIHGTEYWFDQPGILQKRQPQQVRDARGRLTERGRPHTAGRIIAELHFGFWTTLLSDPYHSHFWMPGRASMLKESFPHMSNAQRIRGDIHRRYDTLRYLRNRVFHFEPVWDGVPIPFKQTVAISNVEDLYRDALEAIGWISPVLRDSVRLLDHFDDTYQNGRQHIEAELRQHFALWSA